MSIFDFFRKKKEVEIEEEFNLENEINSISTNEKIESVEDQNGNDLEFVDSSGFVFSSLPIQLAKDVPVSSRAAIENANKKFTFPLCPGMFDYSQVGYIMPAWVDFHIIANKAGVKIFAGAIDKEKRGSHFKDPNQMGAEIVEGLFQVHDGIPLQPFNFNSPWKIFSKKKSISALLLPAFYHTNPEILDNLYIYPGIVDYDKFHTANIICAVRRRCNFTIHAGEPLLHIIPFVNSDIVCGYGPATEEQRGQSKYDPKIYQNQYYRKHHHTKKKYKLDESQVQDEEQKVAGGTEIVQPGTEIMTPGTEIMAPGTEIMIPGTEIVIPGTEILTPIIPGTEIINPGNLVEEKPKRKSRKRDR